MNTAASCYYCVFEKEIRPHYAASPWATLIEGLEMIQFRLCVCVLSIYQYLHNFAPWYTPKSGSVAATGSWCGWSITSLLRKDSVKLVVPAASFSTSVTARFQRRLHVPGTFYHLPSELHRHSLRSGGRFNLHCFLVTVFPIPMTDSFLRPVHVLYSARTVINFTVSMNVILWTLLGPINAFLIFA